MVVASLFFLIIYDAASDQAQTRQLGGDAASAMDAYEAAEREHDGRPGVSVVLVSADSLKTVHALYGNYFGRAELAESVRAALGA